jgi:hypothetical protein
METLNKNGVSITQTPGEEKYIKCCLVHSMVKFIISMILVI